MRRTYLVEYDDDDGEGRQKVEDEGKGRARVSRVAAKRLPRTISQRVCMLLLLLMMMMMLSLYRLDKPADRDTAEMTPR